MHLRISLTMFVILYRLNQLCQQFFNNPKCTYYLEKKCFAKRCTVPCQNSNCTMFGTDHFGQLCRRRRRGNGTNDIKSNKSKESRIGG
ncbi:unnamed protein product [Adineta steineri]|uniref:Uncharacterized protein n=1 Tax=Adineta steineri TaxID=433720 RepID=A0A815AUS6_9BILA|nr:unnamed protein product [Adineta steineri]CAF1551603.1 unnamed protein product [Adineta steineri]